MLKTCQSCKYIPAMKLISVNESNHLGIQEQKCLYVRLYSITEVLRNGYIFPYKLIHLFRNNKLIYDFTN